MNFQAANITLKTYTQIKKNRALPTPREPRCHLLVTIPPAKVTRILTILTMVQPDFEFHIISITQYVLFWDFLLHPCHKTSNGTSLFFPAVLFFTVH